MIRSLCGGYIHPAYVASAVVFVVALSLPKPADAYGGFTQPKGSLYAKLSLSTMSSNQFYDLQGNLKDRGRDFTQRALGLYAEYGVLDGLTLIVNFPVLKANAYANTDTVYGIGDVQAEVKYGVQFGPLHLAASVAPEFPTGRDDAEVETDTGLGLLLPTGDGEFNVWSRLGASYAVPLSGVDWLSAWASVGVGYNLRTDGFSDQIGFGAEIGTQWWDAFYVQANLRGQFVPTTSEELEFAGFIYGEGTEFVAAGLGAAVYVPRTPVAVTLDVQRPLWFQQNLYGGTVFIGGVSMSLPR